jgi:hypothetical protein
MGGQSLACCQHHGGGVLSHSVVEVAHQSHVYLMVVVVHQSHDHLKVEVVAFDRLQNILVMNDGACRGAVNLRQQHFPFHLE